MELCAGNRDLKMDSDDVLRDSACI